MPTFSLKTNIINRNFENKLIQFFWNDLKDTFIKKAFKGTVQVNSSDPDLINDVDCYFQVKIHTISQYFFCIKKSASHLKRNNN